MLPDGAVSELLVTFSDNFAERREIKRTENLEAGQKLPGSEEQNHADDAEPVRYPGTQSLPRTIGGQRLRRIDGNQVEGVLFLFRRERLLQTSCERMYAPWLQLSSRALRAFQISNPDFK